ncbi:MAG: response regulator, partial [Nitrospirota bacterium]
MNATKPRILCVDDDPVNLKLFEAVLVQNGYEVIKTENSREAIERIAKQRIDLVLLDVMMPGISGLDLCRMIKDDKSFRNIPVIMVTGIALNEIRTRCIGAGADDFIAKPFSITEVLARIKILLRAKDLGDKLD